jgi:hypothetical protein
MIRRKLLNREQELFGIGKFVMLPILLFCSDGKEHPDAGRIGKILSVANGNLACEFFNDDLIGKMSGCILPKKYFLPIPGTLVEEYFPRAKKRGFRLSEHGMVVFARMNWPKNDATEGRA